MTIKRYLNVVLKLVLFPAVFVFLSSCATTLTQTPITDLNKRFEFEKYSYLPPQGDNWFILINKPDGSLTILGKQINPATPLGMKSFQPHTIRGQIRGLHVGEQEFENQQDFLDQVKQAEIAGTSSRFTTLQSSYSLYEQIGEYCVIIEKLSEDRGVPKDPGTVYIFQEYKLSCYDPDSNMFISAGCSQRAPDENALIKVKKECEPFINSISFK